MKVSFLQVEGYAEEQCPICLDSLDEDVWAHGAHRFHGRCITLAVIGDPACPLCRRQVDNTTLIARDAFLKQEMKVINKVYKASFVMTLTLYSLPLLMGEDKPGVGMMQCAGLAFFAASLVLRMYGESVQARRGS